jgi:hypothetical protein
MTYTTPVVSYSTAINGTYTALTGITSITITRGRQRFQDPVQPMTMNLELIPANSYAVPLQRGQFIDVRATSSANSDGYFQGQITEVKRKYEIPYNSVSGAAPADRITIEAVGAIGQLSGNIFTNYSWLNQLTSTLIGTSAGNAGVRSNEVQNDFNRVSPQTYNGSSFDLMNKCLRQLQYEAFEIDQNRSSGDPRLRAGFSPTGFQWSDPLAFSDAGTSGAYQFKDIEYLSSVRDSFTQILVEPAGLAVQSAQIGSAPFNPLQYETFNETTSAASDLASYVLALNSQNTPTPFMLRTDTTTGSGVLALARMPSINDTFYPNITSGGTFRSIIGAPVRITFRGSTVLGALKGTSVSFYPDRASVTLYIAPFEYSFQLDSATLGVLDQNRLGLQ